MNLGQFGRIVARRHQAGFSLVEVMVVIVVSLLASLAVFGVLSTSESKKRTATSVNDVNQAGAYAIYLLDKAVRSAGSAVAQAYTYTYGCQISASVNGSQILPATYTAPTEFANTFSANSGAFRFAPVLIDEANGIDRVSDVLIVMAGNSGKSEFPTSFAPAGTGSRTISNLVLTNTVGYSPNDMILVGDTGSSNALSPCTVNQISGTFIGNGTSQNLPLAGTRSTTTNMSAISNKGFVIDLGQPSASGGPSFMLYGIGYGASGTANNNVFVGFDLLQLSAQACVTCSTVLADGILEFHALYGVDTVGNGIITQWVQPIGAYSIATLTAGTPAAAATLKTIKAVRVGLIARTDLPEQVKNGQVATGSNQIQLFTDLGAALTYTRALTAADKNYRYRTFEATIPIRNNMI